MAVLNNNAWLVPCTLVYVDASGDCPFVFTEPPVFTLGDAYHVSDGDGGGTTPAPVKTTGQLWPRGKW